MASTRPSGFTEPEEQFLQSEHAEYRRTPGREKERFRNRCALHIIRLRNLVEDNRYILELFNNKVRNWFQNNAPVKKTRLPLAINQAFHPERVWGMKHKDDIRTGIEESRPEAVDDNAPYVVVWNAKRKELWGELSAEEKKIYQRLAEEWSEHGPDDDLKPEMAERRAVSWMKAVALLFWQQCRMPIFIYGCFEDTKAQLQGATFDTSLLFEGSDERKGKPTFRSSKDWATDFRRYFYEFFTPFIRPDLASPDAMEYLRTKSKRVVEPFEFETNDEGWPLLPDANVERWDTLRRQEVLRMWLTRLYGFACGQAVLAVPWRSITKVPHKFFAPGMLPPNVDMGDPSKIPKIPLGLFYDHVHRIEQGLIPDLPRFQFSNFETGPESNREYPAAINTTDVPEWKPRRAKKKVLPPTFDTAPGNTDAEEDGDDEREHETQAASKKSKRGGMFNPGKKFYKDVEKLRKEKERAKAKEEKAAAKAAAAAKKKKRGGGSKKKSKGKGKGKSADSTEDEVWNTDVEDTPDEDQIADFEAVDNDVPGASSEESEEEEPLARRQLATPGPASDDSDDEVEEALERYEDVLSSSAVRKSANAVASSSRLQAESASASRAHLQRASSSKVAASAAVKLRAAQLPSTVVGNSPPPDASRKGKDRADPTPALRTPSEGATIAADAPPADPQLQSSVAPAPDTTPADSSSPHRSPSAAPEALMLPPVIVGADASSPEATAHAGEPTFGEADWELPTGRDLSPSDVPADGRARLRYLQSLDGEKPYLDMLHRAKTLLSVTTPIRVKPPLFWASWGYQSPFLPKDAHLTEKGPRTVQSIINFLKKGATPSAMPAEAQRFCLVMGLTLKNIMALQMVDHDDPWLEKLPPYMATSTLTFPMRDPLLNVCQAAFQQPSPAPDPTRGPTPPAAGPSTGGPSSPPPVAGPSKPARTRRPAATDPQTEGSQPAKARSQARRQATKQRASRAPATTTAEPSPPDSSAPAGARRSSRLRK